MKVLTILLFIFFTILNSTSSGNLKEKQSEDLLTADILNFNGTPESPEDRTLLAFSDQGSWFAYSLPDKPEHYGGFSGPFLMTQDNGVWISPVLSRLVLTDNKTGTTLKWEEFTLTKAGFSSHLEQNYEGDKLNITMKLFFISPHTAFTNVLIENVSDSDIELSVSWRGEIFLNSIKTLHKTNGIRFSSGKSKAEGFINVSGTCAGTFILISDKSYRIELHKFRIPGGSSEEISVSHTFIFPEYSIPEENKKIKRVSLSPAKYLRQKISEKSIVLKNLFFLLPKRSQSTENKDLIAKSLLTMQNNWRSPAGELKNSGLFPSYSYKWFHGFWAWDSWKHAAALARFDSELAKEQVRAMYNFQNDRGMIADCVYRDTSIEKHNYRNTKPPLSAWAVWLIYSEDRDIEFLKEIFPKIEKQHKWWYEERDHDRDGICEYGSTDGTLIAAKWESGMDNGVRFDRSKLLKNSESAWSLDQESVDLNSYLYAEKIFLSRMAVAINKNPLSESYIKDAAALKIKIREQFFDPETGWFYDTSMDGGEFIRVIGCEGWIPLWAEAATFKQAEKLKAKMTDPAHFNGHVPLQTLSFEDPEFNPEKGYWRGPVWLDQAYFGVIGLLNYGFEKDASILKAKLINNTEGVTEPGKSLRENYNPRTGKGLNARNFSWTAAHFMLLLLDG